MKKAVKKKRKDVEGKKDAPKKRATKKRASPKRKAVRRVAEKTNTPKTKRGMAMKQKRKSRKAVNPPKSSRRRARRGGGGLGNKFRMGGVVDGAKEAAVAIGGGILAGVVANKLPIQNPLLKTLSPVIAGAAMLGISRGRNKLLAQMGIGMMVLGGVATIKAKFPQVPMLAGEEEYMPQQLGYYPDDDLGVEEIAGPMEIAGSFATAADI